MMKIWFVLILFVMIIESCTKHETVLGTNAFVVGFHAEKFMCCWGWDIKIDADTIRTESGIVGQVIGFVIKESIPVLIELGKKETDCSSRFSNIDFYDVVKIERIK